MEYIKNKHKTKKIICIIIAIIFMTFVIWRTYLVNTINSKFADRTKYDTDKMMFREVVGDAFVVCGKADFFDVSIEAGVQSIDYVDSNGIKWDVTFNIWVDGFGRYSYGLGMCQSEDDQIGGLVYIDNYLNFEYENPNDTKQNEYIANLMKENWDEMIKLINIAKDKWGIEINTVN